MPKVAAVRNETSSESKNEDRATSRGADGLKKVRWCL